MPTILLYFGLALVVLLGVIIAVPDDGPATPPPSPMDVMMELSAPQRDAPEAKP
jgi:hypothetical protein